jgi:hypothetical protein
LSAEIHAGPFATIIVPHLETPVAMFLALLQ